MNQRFKKKNDDYAIEIEYIKYLDKRRRMRWKKMRREEEEKNVI